MAIIPAGGGRIIVEKGDGMALYRIAGKIVVELGKDINSILDNDSNSSPSGFLRKAFSKSASDRVYFAPRNANDGYPPRLNTLRDVNQFSSRVSSKISTSGFKVLDRVQLQQTGGYRHKSIFGKTKGQPVYPWNWIDEGTTHKNRFTGNPRNLRQTFIRDWHVEGYRGIFINKMGTQLKHRGWEVVK